MQFEHIEIKSLCEQISIYILQNIHSISLLINKIIYKNYIKVETSLITSLSFAKIYNQIQL